MLLRAHCVVAFILLLGFLGACTRPPIDDPASADSQKLPFDRQPRPSGITPSQAVIPSTTKLPEGTTIPVLLQSALSSASSHAGDTFRGLIDEPVVIEGQMLIGRGTVATGRVLEAKPATSAGQRVLEPGYLRIVLESVNVDDKPVTIETSSIFAKGGSREDRSQAGPPVSARPKDCEQKKL